MEYKTQEQLGYCKIVEIRDLKSLIATLIKLESNQEKSYVDNLLKVKTELLALPNRPVQMKFIWDYINSMESDTDITFEKIMTLANDVHGLKLESNKAKAIRKLGHVFSVSSLSALFKNLSDNELQLGEECGIDGDFSNYDIHNNTASGLIALKNKLDELVNQSIPLYHLTTFIKNVDTDFNINHLETALENYHNSTKYESERISDKSNYALDILNCIKNEEEVKYE